MPRPRKAHRLVRKNYKFTPELVARMTRTRKLVHVTETELVEISLNRTCVKLPDRKSR